MPTPRFYRLNENKRMQIITAAAAEFAGKPMEKVSINRVIFGAGISRGSFYTYFYDKKDLLRGISYEYERLFLNWLNACDHDIFRASECMLEAVFAPGRCEGASEKLMASLTPEMIQSLIGVRKEEDEPAKGVDASRSLWSLIHIILVRAVLYQYYSDLPREQILTEAKQQIEMIKTGVGETP